MISSSVPVEASEEDFRAGSRGEGGSQWRGGERSEPPRNEEPPSPRQSGDTQKGTERPKTHNHGAPDPEVREKPVRRRFSAEYKRRILDEADACTEPGQIGALLRREGLYSSHLVSWRRRRDKILSEGLAAKKRGRKPAKDPRDERLMRLERENARFKQRLEEAEIIIDIQKKASQLLGIKLADVSEHEKILREEGNE
jgi:transposase-like protein